MDNSSLIVGLDIGTTNVKAVVSDASSDQLRIIGATSVPTAGMDHGNIVDIDQTADAIVSVLSHVEERTNTKIHRVITGIPASMLQLQTARGVINLSDSAREITDDDVRKVTTAALNSSVKEGREAVTFLPTKFVVDNEDKIIDPRKMIGTNLEVVGIFVTAPTAALHNIKKAIERAGYENNFFVATPLAIADVALDDGERDFGTILLDIGGGQTTATVIKKGKINYATVEPNAGVDITKDISIVLNTSLADAEKLKINYGIADPAYAKEENQVPVNVVGKESPTMISEAYLSEIINSRLEEILARIGNGLLSNHAFDLPGGVVITGGTSGMPGLDQLVADLFQVNTRVYVPDQLGLRDPRYATGYGIVNYAYDLHDIDFLVNSVINQQLTFSKNDDEDIQPEETLGFFKRPKKTHENVNNSKTEIEKHQTPTKNIEPEQKSTQNNKKGFKDLFKTFFD